MNTRQIYATLAIDGLQEVDSELLIAQQRNDEIMQIERSVVETNDLFMELSIMVHHQGERIDNIESNVSQAVKHTEQGTQALEKADEYHRGCNIL